jgi:tetratricopeptide (TPR) repeat protein
VATKKQTQTEKTEAKKPAAAPSLFGALDGVAPNAGTWVKRALLVVVILLAAMLVVWQLRNARKTKGAKAYAALAAAATADEYDRVAANYGGTKVSAQAELCAAQRFFENGSYKEAGERFAAVAGSKDKGFALRGLLGQAQAMEAAAVTDGKVDKERLGKAEKLFDDAAKQAATAGMPAAQVDALLGQARCQRRLGDAEKARKTAEMAQKITEKPDDQILSYLGQNVVKNSIGAIDTYELAAPAPPPQKTEDKADEKTDQPADKDAAPAPAPAPGPAKATE